MCQMTERTLTLMSQFIQALQTKLQTALDATQVDIVDNTWMHAGHAGSNGGAHLRITVASPRFASLGIIDQHRMVQDLLQDEMRTNAIHALELKTLEPSA
jgi:BolA family transcriptional regulator, general stress-responsive regulator